MPRPSTLALLIACALPVAAQAASDPLADAVRARLEGDRTGACLAVALIEADRVRRAFHCAGDRPAPDAATAFEIGSVSKTMTSVLLARLIGEGRASLDDPLARHLPAGTRVPDFEGRPILLRHLVTHTSGLPPLPPGIPFTSLDDPYAAITPEALLEALGRSRLEAAPGARFQYSNFAAMLLSQAVAHTGGADVETQLRTRLFAPLGMQHAHVRAKPAGARVAQGHQPGGLPTSAWNFHVDLAGVGGVRASLDDMVRYVQAQWSRSGDDPLDAALVRTHAPVATEATPRQMGMNWMLAPWRGGGTLVAHEGGTGGFSSLVAFVPGQRRGVVILSDTALTSTGGLGALGMHLLDPSTPAPKPRRRIDAPAALLASLAGEYELDGGLRMRLWVRDGALWSQASGQAAYELAHDDAGDFYPLGYDALLRPRRGADGRYTFVLMQGGGAAQARRIGAEPTAPTPDAAAVADLSAYAGEYPLVPGFSLTFSVRGGLLHVQGTGQPAIALDPVGKDVFAAPAVGAELAFERDAQAAVVAVTLRQNGQVLRGEKKR